MRADTVPKKEVQKTFASPARKIKEFKPKVLFVGAGRVGLYAAIQTKLYAPEVEILMLEKSPEYKGVDPIQLNKDSFKNSNPNPQFQKLLNVLPETIPTNELENKLKQFAKKLGIKFDCREVKNCLALSEEYPSVAVIVGSDGARSRVRKQIFGKALRVENETLASSNLSAYRSQEFTKKTLMLTWFLVGNAAFDVPSARSLNNGFICGNQLAKAIQCCLLYKLILPQHSFSSFKKKLVAPLLSYNKFVSDLANAEFSQLIDPAFSMQNETISPIRYIAIAKESIKQEISDQNTDQEKRSTCRIS